MPLEARTLKQPTTRSIRYGEIDIAKRPLLFDDVKRELTAAGKRYIREEFGELIEEDYNKAVRIYYLMETKAQEFALKKHPKFHPY